MRTSLSGKACACVLAAALSFMAIPGPALAVDAGSNEGGGASGPSNAAEQATADVRTDDATSLDETQEILPKLIADDAVVPETVEDGAAALASPEASVQASTDGVIAVSGPADFKQMETNPTGTFELTEDIDFSSFAPDDPRDTCVVSGSFMGTIRGNGFSVHDLVSYPLFEDFQGTVENLGVRMVTIPNTGISSPSESYGSFANAFACYAKNATFRNVTFNGVWLKGSYEAGVVAAEARGCRFERVYLTGCDVFVSNGGSSSGIFAGYLSECALVDCRIDGQLETFGSGNGIVAGNVEAGSFENVIVTASLEANAMATGSSNVNGCFFGDISYGAPVVRNCVVSGLVVPTANVPIDQCYAFAKSSAEHLAGVESLYVFDDATGAIDVDGMRFKRVASSTFDDADQATEFFYGTGFSPSSWDYFEYSSGWCVPKPNVAYARDWQIDWSFDYANEAVVFSGPDANGLAVTDGSGGASKPIDGPYCVSSVLDAPNSHGLCYILVHKEDDGSHGVALDLAVGFPARLPMPSVTSVEQPASEGATGSVRFASAGTYQRRIAGTEEWEAVELGKDAAAGSSEPLSLAIGRYEIRCMDAGTLGFPSAPVLVEIRPFGAAQTGDLVYRVTLNANGGTIDYGNVTQYVWGNGAVLPTNLSRAGYRFQGWYSDAGLWDGALVDSISLTDYGDKEFWAKWCSSDTAMSSITVCGVEGTIAGTTITVRLPEKPAAWEDLYRGIDAKCASGGITQYQLTGVWDDIVDSCSIGLVVTAEDGVTQQAYTLTVAFGDATGPGPEQPDAPKTYNVALFPGLGQIVSGHVGSYTAGTAVALPTDVKRDGYVFAGWYDNQQCVGSPITEIGADSTGDLSFYAKWLSSATGFLSVRVDGRAGEVTGTFANVVLPLGSTIPTDANKVAYTLVTGATAGPIATTDGGATWTFVCTAEDGITTATCTIAVSVAQTQEEMDLAEVMAFSSSLFSRLNDVTEIPELSTVGKQEHLEKWLDEMIGQVKAELGSDVDIVRTVEAFYPPIHGTLDNPAGTNGYYRYNVVVSKGAAIGGTGGEPLVHALSLAGVEEGDEPSEEGRMHPASAYVSVASVISGRADEHIRLYANESVTDADAARIKENPKTLTFAGEIAARPYGQGGFSSGIGGGLGAGGINHPVVRSPQSISGDLARTGDGAVVWASALLVAGSLAAAGAYVAMRFGRRRSE